MILWCQTAYIVSLMDIQMHETNTLLRPLPLWSKCKMVNFLIVYLESEGQWHCLMNIGRQTSVGASRLRCFFPVHFITDGRTYIRTDVHTTSWHYTFTFEGVVYKCMSYEIIYNFRKNAYQNKQKTIILLVKGPLIDYNDSTQYITRTVLWLLHILPKHSFLLN